MQRVRLKGTGKVIAVTRSEAHRLIDSGQGELVTELPKKPQTYTTRQVRPQSVQTK